MTTLHKGRAQPDGPGGMRRPATTASTNPRPQDPCTAEGIPQFDSATLLRGHSSVAITHGGSVYRLQATRQGKLILTK